MNKFSDLDQYLQFLNNLYGDKFNHSRVFIAEGLVPIEIKCNTCTYWFDISSRHHQSGKTVCQYCTGRLMNAEIFAKKSQIIHPNENYDYSKVHYTTNKVKVDIICPQHGIFPQTPNNHLRGQKCPHCQGKAPHTTQSFTDKANKVHNNLYDYYKTIYGQNNSVKVIIICKNHGEFSQTPDSHLGGHGCPYCFGNAKWTKDQFLDKATQIHKNKYDYSKLAYTNLTTKGIIICPIHGEFEQAPRNHLKSHGCWKCAHILGADKRKLGKEEFVRRSNIIHQNFYSYEQVIYKNNSTKISITCPIHGDFDQSPEKHLIGHGCIKCSGIYSPTIQEFIEAANKAHHNKYDYSKFEYIDSKYPSIIICPNHGEFPQRPGNHLNQKHGCPKCAGVQLLTLEEFIDRSNKIHNNKYDYSKFEYINGNIKSVIICPIHGEFEQKGVNHLSGSGCQQCGILKRAESKKLGLEEFIKQSNITHNFKYDYSKSTYIHCNIKTIIICPKHGEFLQTPHKHLGSAHGCPKCITIISKPETEWLDLIGIPPEYRNLTIKYGDKKRCRPDGFDPITNTIYEFDGDFWHGNPQVYVFEDFNPITKTTFGYLCGRTINRKFELLYSGYQVVSIWGKEFELIQNHLNFCSLEIKTQITNALKISNGTDIINQFIHNI